MPRMAASPLAVHHGHTSIGSTIAHLLESAATFFSQLASLSWGPLLIGLACYALYLLLRSRALLGGAASRLPGRAGPLARRVGRLHGRLRDQQRVPARRRQHRPAVPDARRDPAEQLHDGRRRALDGVVFDWFMGVLVMCFAFTQGVFPKPPDFSKLPAFDISFFASNMRFTLFFLTLLGIAFLVAFALLSAKVRAFWERVRQG